MVIHNPKVGSSIQPPATNNLLILNTYEDNILHLERDRVQFVSRTNSTERIRNWSGWLTKGHNARRGEQQTVTDFAIDKNATCK
jgi:hypothetical protein